MATGESTAATDHPARPLSDALREAINAHLRDGGSYYQLARATDRLLITRFRKFVEGKCDLQLDTAESLAAALGRGIVDRSGVAIGAESGSLVAGLRMAIELSGTDPGKLRYSTGIHAESISSFMAGTGTLLLRSADRLALVLGLSLAPIRSATVGLQREDFAGPRPISDGLRAAIRARGLRSRQLAGMAGLQYQPIIAFMAEEIDLAVATADKLAAIVGLKLAFMPDRDGPELPDDMAGAIRQAINASPVGAHEIARRTGLYYHIVSGFMRGQHGMRLSTADKLASAIGLSLGPGRAEPTATPSAQAAVAPPSSRDDLNRELREAIKASGLSAREVSTRSGLSLSRTKVFIKGLATIDYSSIIKVADSLGILLEPLSLKQGAVKPATRRCPVELFGPDLPPKFGGVEASKPLTPTQYDIMMAMIQLEASGKPRNSEVDIDKKSGHRNPVRTLRRMAKNTFFQPYIHFPVRKNTGGYGFRWPTGESSSDDEVA